jgi:hypothetical protein
MNDLNTQRMDILGADLRFLRTDRGPTVVLLYTQWTQLDYFIPLRCALQQNLAIVAPDLPGPDLPRSTVEPVCRFA